MDTAHTIARDLVAEIGRLNALRYLAGEFVRARTWGETAQVARLMWAVVWAR